MKLQRAGLLFVSAPQWATGAAEASPITCLLVVTWRGMSISSPPAAAGPAPDEAPLRASMKSQTPSDAPPSYTFDRSGSQPEEQAARAAGSRRARRRRQPCGEP